MCQEFFLYSDPAAKVIIYLLRSKKNLVAKNRIILGLQSVLVRFRWYSVTTIIAWQISGHSFHSFRVFRIWLVYGPKCNSTCLIFCPIAFSAHPLRDGVSAIVEAYSIPLLWVSTHPKAGMLLKLPQIVITSANVLCIDFIIMQSNLSFAPFEDQTVLSSLRQNSKERDLSEMS
jgi:hypothetical protein